MIILLTVAVYFAALMLFSRLTASRGADKVESIGKQHRQQKTTILFMFLP